MLCSECTQSVYESTETNTLDSNKACVDIFTRHSWLWTEICLLCRHEIARICRCRLGREWTGRVPLVVVSLWDQPWFPGAAGNKLL
jgi:hypothetical protein